MLLIQWLNHVLAQTKHKFQVLYVLTLLDFYMLLGENSIKSHLCWWWRWTEFLACQFCLPSYQIFQSPLKYFLEFLLVVQLVSWPVLMEYTKIFKLYPVQEGKNQEYLQWMQRIWSLPMCIYLLILKECKLDRPSLSEGLSAWCAVLTVVNSGCLQ